MENNEARAYELLKVVKEHETSTICVGCHNNLNSLLNIFHTRKVDPCCLKLYVYGSLVCNNKRMVEDFKELLCTTNPAAELQGLPSKYVHSSKGSITTNFLLHIIAFYLTQCFAHG